MIEDDCLFHSSDLSIWPRIHKNGVASWIGMKHKSAHLDVHAHSFDEAQKVDKEKESSQCFFHVYSHDLNV